MLEASVDMAREEGAGRLARSPLDEALLALLKAQERYEDLESRDDAIGSRATVEAWLDMWRAGERWRNLSASGACTD
jgi:hypothetical protein